MAKGPNGTGENAQGWERAWMAPKKGQGPPPDVEWLGGVQVETRIMMRRVHAWRSGAVRSLCRERRRSDYELLEVRGLPVCLACGRRAALMGWEVPERS